MRFRGLWRHDELHRWGRYAAGGLLGGFLGEIIGIRPTLLLAALGEILSVLWLVLSPMRSLRKQSTPME
jgi:predicted MFS family arabinose efflux permease